MTPWISSRTYVNKSSSHKVVYTWIHLSVSKFWIFIEYHLEMHTEKKSNIMLFILHLLLARSEPALIQIMQTKGASWPSEDKYYWWVNNSEKQLLTLYSQSPPFSLLPFLGPIYPFVLIILQSFFVERY